MHETQRLKTSTVEKVEELIVKLIRSKKLDKVPASFDEKLEVLLDLVNIKR